MIAVFARGPPAAAVVAGRANPSLLKLLVSVGKARPVLVSARRWKLKA
jgi:hypothetical protein